MPLSLSYLQGSCGCVYTMSSLSLGRFWKSFFPIFFLTLSILLLGSYYAHFDIGLSGSLLFASFFFSFLLFRPDHFNCFSFKLTRFSTSKMPLNSSSEFFISVIVIWFEFLLVPFYNFYFLTDIHFVHILLTLFFCLFVCLLFSLPHWAYLR